MFLLKTLVFCLFISLSLSNPCADHETCRACIQSASNCAWCGAKTFKHTRCDSLSALKQNECPQSSVQFTSNQVRVLRDDKLSRTKVASHGEAIQIQPQRVGLKLRRKQPLHLKLLYKQAVDYPVDLYYLMDLSRTMLVHKRTLAHLGNDLAGQMKEITKNFRLGFGSFVDKTVLPFTDTHPERLESPCSDCSKVYGFRNHMSLTTNASLFSQRVSESPISGNIDGPEGGFDAIMQAVVCGSEIGWRRDARHLLIYTSDSLFHFGGDGRLAGIMRPNDEKCHLDGDGFYTKSNYQDYPTISQINSVSQTHNVHIIFAIAGQRIDSYARLLHKIKSSSLAQLTSDSSNIVNIIKAEYEKISSNIQLSDNSSEYLRIQYFSSCLGSEVMKTSICRGIQVDDQIEFQIVVELLSCPANGQFREIVKVNPIGLDEGLLMEIDMICSCDCEIESKTQPKSEECNRRGTFECGICRCEDETYGQRCECSSSKLDSDKSDEKCYQNSSSPHSDSRICSGHGHCMCGQCSCFQTKTHLYSGKFCECDDMNCGFVDGKLCGGPDRGVCNCGQCICSEKWTGINCGCTTELTTCIDPATGRVCNDRGPCECGMCRCNSTEYSGPFCDECPSCDGQCPVFTKVVENQIVIDIKETSGPNYVSYLKDNLTTRPEDKVCKFIGADDCVYVFKYRHVLLPKRNSSPANFVIEASRIKSCKQPIDIAFYSVRFTGIFIVVGVFTLIAWRIFTFCLDRHEYHKFIKSCKNIDFPENQNPLYKPSTTTFMNPEFSNCLEPH